MNATFGFEPKKSYQMAKTIIRIAAPARAASLGFAAFRGGPGRFLVLVNGDINVLGRGLLLAINRAEKPKLLHAIKADGFVADHAI